MLQGARCWFQFSNSCERSTTKARENPSTRTVGVAKKQQVDVKLNTLCTGVNPSKWKHWHISFLQTPKRNTPLYISPKYLVPFLAHSPRHQCCTHAALSVVAPSPPQPWASGWLSRRTPEPSETPLRTTTARFRQPRQTGSASGGATLAARPVAPCRRPRLRCQGA